MWTVSLRIYNCLTTFLRELVNGGLVKFKYALHHGGCMPCPPPHAKGPAGEFNAYRLVSGTDMIADDFLPPAMLSIPRGFPTKPRKCTDLALSFFTTAEKAAKKFKSLKKLPAWSRNHIAQTMIKPLDGHMTEPSGSGHFDLHEAATAALHSQSKYLKPL
jgi:hypothetical protein